MRERDRRDLADRLRAVPLVNVLRLLGALPDPRDPYKWRTPQGVLSIRGAKFINWTRGTGGGGAIDLVMHLRQLGFLDALRWLQDAFPELPSLCLPLVPPVDALKLPLPDPAQQSRVEAYLVQQRALPASLITELLACGDLYADVRANAVFLLRDAQHRPIGAELRGTTQQTWRGMAPGSRKDRGFFAIPATPSSSTVLCESAIDAISCFALHTDRRCISTSGARPNPTWLSDLLQSGCSVECGFDGDPTGEAMAAAMISMHPTIHRLRPCLHDWNDVLRARTAR